MRRNMPTFTRKYTDEQREALGVAVVDRGISPARRVVELAARGELVLDGRNIEPFETNANTVRDAASKLRKRRAGQQRSKLERERPRDAVEQLRVRLVRLADREIAACERAARGKVDPERMRQLARAVREIVAIPERHESAPPAPGQKEPGTGRRTGGETRGGMAGSILAAHGHGAAARVQTQREGSREATAQDIQQGHGVEGHTARPAQQANDTSSSEQDGSPGEWARAQAARLAGASSGAGGADG